jgi:GTP-binding protein
VRTHAGRFLHGTGDPARLPRALYPEIAFAGRSNVGKSSLLNRLVGQRGLARVSKTPGRTQQINFFLIDERLVFVDLPGYGFARVPAPVQQQWKHLVERYLVGRRTLRAVVVLVDLRRGIEADDAQLLAYLRAHAIAAIVVATKADKLSRSQRVRAAGLLAAQVGGGSTCIVSSAATGDGLAEVWTEIRSRIEAAGTPSRTPSSRANRLPARSHPLPRSTP